MSNAPYEVSFDDASQEYVVHAPKGFSIRGVLLLAEGRDKVREKAVSKYYTEIANQIGNVMANQAQGMLN